MKFETFRFVHYGSSFFLYLINTAVFQLHFVENANWESGKRSVFWLCRDFFKGKQEEMNRMGIVWEDVLCWNGEFGGSVY